MFKNKKNKQKGSAIALVEIAMSIAVLYAGIYTYNTLSDTNYSYLKRTKNDAAITDMYNVMLENYKNNASTIEKTEDARIVENDFVIENNSFISTDTMRKLSAKTSVRLKDGLDGYSKPFKIFVSKRLEYYYMGVNIPYRVIAIVSSNNGETYKSKMIPSTGQLSIDKSEKVLVINTLSYQISNFNESVDKLDKISYMYSRYYFNSYNNYNEKLSNKNKNYVNFFYDNNNIKKTSINSIFNGYNTAGEPMNEVFKNIKNSMGLNSDLFSSNYLYKDAWGNDMYIMNSGEFYNIKVGGNYTTLKAKEIGTNDEESLPFTSIVSFTMSNGETYYKTVLSRT